MPEYLAPAVYVEEVSFRAPSIEGVGTTTTGFAGPTLTGPVGTTPELLTSFGDFQTTYGGFDQLSLYPNNAADPRNSNFLALSVKAFFDNGGSELYVSRVFSAASATDTGNASAAIPTSSPTVTVSARFPGAFANFQQVTTNLVATKTAAGNLVGLPSGSLVVSALSGPTPIGTLGKIALATDNQITLAVALTGSNPTFVLVDGEIMDVTLVDSTKTILSVNRAQDGTSRAQHAAGAPVFPPIGTLSAAVNPGATQITLGAAVTGGTPLSVQLGAELLSVTAIDSTDEKLTVAPALAATHNSGDAVFGTMYATYYTNGSGTTFQSGSTPLGTLPAWASLYVLTIAVSTYGAASSKVTVPTAQPALVYSGLGFDPLHPNYIGLTLGATPPRHIDALQNQVAFSITGSSAAPLGLFNTLFGTWGGPGTSASQVFTLNGGDDGVEPQSNDYDTALTFLDGLEDIAIVAAPGSSAFDASQDIITTLITHVSMARAYRIAILDTPFGGLDSDYEDVRAQIDSSYAALYVPWVKMANPLAKTGTAIPSTVYVPPSGFMAGIYARSDDQTSVGEGTCERGRARCARFRAQNHVCRASAFKSARNQLPALLPRSWFPCLGCANGELGLGVHVRKRSTLLDLPRTLDR